MNLKKIPSPRYVPLSIFTSQIGILEALVKYIKENFDLNGGEIASLLNRNRRTILATYRKVKKFETIKRESELLIPIEIFSDRRFGPLESISLYLKEKGLKYREIASLLDRDERNIWTVYNRALKKRGDAS